MAISAYVFCASTTLRCIRTLDFRATKHYLNGMRFCVCSIVYVMVLTATQSLPDLN